MMQFPYWHRRASRQIYVVTVREIEPGEEEAVCELARRVFGRYVAPGLAELGVREFHRFADPQAMLARLDKGGFVLAAIRAGELTEMLEFAPPDRIAMLFVSWQQHGVAKRLLEEAIRRIHDRYPGLTRLTVHSSSFAEPIYERMGFIKAGEMTTSDGITYVPMERRVA